MIFIWLFLKSFLSQGSFHPICPGVLFSRTILPSSMGIKKPNLENLGFHQGKRMNTKDGLSATHPMAPSLGRRPTGVEDEFSAASPWAFGPVFRAWMALKSAKEK
jgi:hypothetical protein